MSRSGASAFVRAFGWIVLLPGILTALFSLAVASRGMGFGGTTAEGVVTGKTSEQLTGPGGRVRFREHARVTFTTTDGRSIEFTDPLGGAPVPYDAGTKVKVRYDAENPANAQIATTSWLAIGLGAVGVIGGLVLCAIGATLVAAARLPWQVK